MEANVAMIANTDVCAICGEPVVIGYPVHNQCVDKMKANRLVTAQDIKPFDFPDYETVINQIKNEFTDRVEISTKGCRCIIRTAKGGKKLTACIMSDAAGFPIGIKETKNNKEGYEEIEEYAIQRKYDVAISFIE